MALESPPMASPIGQGDARGGAGTAPSGLGAAAKFNPQLWKPDELRAIFVARLGELAQLTQRLHQANAQPAQAPQHVLISGHRGMGKSTLLHRLALQVEDDTALSTQWVPLLFREEQYTAVTLDKFWRNAIDALSEALERRAAQHQADDAPLAAALAAEVAGLDALNAQLDAAPDSRQREDLALAGLRQWADRHHTRLLLLVDSTELLFAGLAQDRNGSQQALWRLRELLSQDARFFWIGCGYAPLEASVGHDHAFFEFFAQMALRPLTVDDMRATFLALAKTFGAGRGRAGPEAETDMQRLLSTQPERLETLLRLAGGNPRTTVLLYQLLAAGGHDSVHTDLQRLLDDMSPLYKDRLENQLAIQPRQLMATLMEHWAPMAARQLADATAMPVTQINAQLSRLEADGWIEKVRLPGTKRKGYQAAERFFNVWYLMRLAPRRLRLRLTWLVEFMRAWFAPRDLGRMAAERAGGHRSGQWREERQYEYSRALSLALPGDSSERAQLELSLLSDTVHGRIGEIMLFDFDGDDRAFASVEDYRRRFFALKPKLEKACGLEGAARDEWVRLLMGSLTLTLAAKEEIADAKLTAPQVEKFLEVLTKEIGGWTAHAADPDAIQSLRERVLSGDLFPEVPDPALLQHQARAWFDESPVEFALLAERCAMRHPSASETASLLAQVKTPELQAPGLLRMLAVRALSAGLPELAEAFLRRTITLDPESAVRWGDLGDLLERHLHRFDEAEAAYRRTMALDENHAYPLTNLARLLAQLGRNDEARDAYRRSLFLCEATRSIAFKHANLRLQAHLWLGNRDAAAQALTDLCSGLGDDANNFFAMAKLEEQARECHVIGLAAPLAELLLASAHAGQLQPLALALQLLSGDDQSLLAAPFEFQQLAREVAERLGTRRAVKPQAVLSGQSQASDAELSV